MKILIFVLLIIGGSTSFAVADCQNLAGKFFYANNPSQSVTIEQIGCAPTMTFENSGNVGKPIQHLGDGVWRVTNKSKYQKQMQASFAMSDSYIVETKTDEFRSAVTYHLVETYRVKADGNISLKSLISSGEIFDSATRLLVRN